MDYMERITIYKNDVGHSVEGDAVESAVVCISGEVVVLALNEIKTGKVAGPLCVSLELIAASGGVGIQVMGEIYI